MIDDPEAAGRYRDLVQPLAALGTARPLDSTHAAFAADRAASHNISLCCWGSPMVLFPAAANQSTIVAPERRRELTGYVMTDSNIKTAVDAVALGQSHR